MLLRAAGRHFENTDRLATITQTAINTTSSILEIKVTIGTFSFDLPNRSFSATYPKWPSIGPVNKICITRKISQHVTVSLASVLAGILSIRPLVIQNRTERLFGCFDK